MENSELVSTPPKRALSPGSATFTVSLESYMEPRLSVVGQGCTLAQTQRSRRPSPSEDSYPVFSPPPYPALISTTQGFMQASGSGSGPRMQRGYGPLLGVPGCCPITSHILSRRSVSSSAPSSHHACNLFQTSHCMQK